MSFNLACFFRGHKTYRLIERDERRKDGIWTVTERRELVGCERCGARNPNHRAFDLLPAATGAAEAVIAKAMGATAQQESKP